MMMHSTPPSHQKPSVSRRYRRGPGGLLLPLHGTLRGRVRWQVLDERGVPEVPRTPSGVAVGPAEGVEQPNLITNLGLDRLALLEARYSFQVGSADRWRRRLAVGTGSTAPDVADTTLDNEVQRSESSGSFSPGNTAYSLDGVANVWRCVTSVTLIVTMNADRNLTELGFAQGTTGDIIIRELLRDGVGTPITVSLLNGKSLRADHTLTIELPAPVAGHEGALDIEEFDAANSLVNTAPYDITYGMQADSTAAVAVQRVFDLWSPWWLSHREGTFVYPFMARRVTNDFAYARIGALAGTIEPSGTPVTGSSLAFLGAYTNGVHERVKVATTDVADLNGAWHGFAISGRTGGGSAASQSGFVALFDDPATYTKMDTDTLRVGIVSTWARA